MSATDWSLSDGTQPDLACEKCGHRTPMLINGLGFDCCARDSGRLPEGEDPKGLSAEQARAAPEEGHRPETVATITPTPGLDKMREAAAKVAETAFSSDYCDGAFARAGEMIAKRIRALPLPLPETSPTVREALTKAAEAFRAYERSHNAKAFDASGWLCDPVRMEKATRNRELAELMEAALNTGGGDGK